MTNKKSVLMTLNHNCGCFSGVGSGIAGNMELEVTQKDVVDNLKTLGFTFRYPRYYTHSEWGEIDISRVHRISDALQMVFELGRRSKAREIRKTLDIV